MRLLACLFALALSAHAAPLLRVLDSSADVGMDSSLQLYGTSIAVSYWDATNDDLKFATCEGDCSAGAGTWRISTVDSAGKVGMYTSLALDNGNAVIAYRDVTNGDLKLATCTDACWTARPSWTIVAVDGTGPNTGLFPSLQLRDGKPVIAYRDLANGDLKLATCTAGCGSPSPSWTIVTVDSAGDVGRYATLRLAGGNPVISYYDVSNGRLKLATCTSNCATASPTWIITVVDDSLNSDEARYSMQLNGANPVISYEGPGNTVKLATCVAACASPSPTWVTTVVDAERFTGNLTSLQLADGKPVIAYSAHGALKIAACTGDCASASPSWSFTIADAGSDFGTGWYASMQLRNGTAYVSYYDPGAGSLRLAIVPGITAAAAANYQALWWGGEAESGWGVNIAHQGDVIFLTWFTYDIDGTGMWLLAPEIRKSAGNTYGGALYRARGPAFDTTPFDFSRVALTSVGTASLQFADDASASFRYVVNGTTQTKRITRLVFDPTHASTCVTGSAAGATPNYQDLWISPDPAQAGWGVNITHQGDILFATWFTYDATGKGQWLVMSRLDLQGPGRYSGGIQRTTGPAFNSVPFNPAAVSRNDVGSAAFDFNARPATFTYTLGGVTQTRAMQRFTFAAPATVCY